MLMASGTEWFPTFGVLWQVVQVPVNEAGTPAAPLRPATPEIVMGSVLNRSWPCAIDARAALVGSLGPLRRPAHESNSVIATELKPPAGPSGSLMPTKKFWWASGTGPPVAPCAPRCCAELSCPCAV